MNQLIEKHIENEIAEAEKLAAAGDAAGAFRHLERAHVLGQSSTYHHTRIHWLMLKHGIRERDAKEIAGQVLRIGGAATKTPFGIYPKGNTGGANVSPIKPMPIVPDLAKILAEAERD
ncbi:DUF3703 domain-containing protein [Leptolyngbya sp. 7M]|uniref:DUF3703 domain-containing protein n=1 Tax=Leptolyngbya sp. 7M TaxID=2812896 RepID=UPI001B8B8DAA|nr:DUF3703 domain-containing protein [Leptolyngbya sp. 7M]QYO66082.1 DUF3703 domain-containing protein [Leptolyngbya sp. 7M]